MQEFEFTKFLGKPVGFNACPNYASFNDLSKLGMDILCSALAPWQRIDALKAFFFSSSQFAMRTAQFKKTDWERIDKLLRKELKTTLSLPEHAANEYLYGHRKHGCLGIPIAAEESDLNLIDSAFKLLTSRDERLRELAIAHLGCTIRPRVKRNPTDQDFGDFLSGEIEGSYSTSSNKLSNIWTLARCASRRLNVEWVFEDGVPRIIYQDLILKPQQRRRVLFSIRDRLRVDRSLRLMNKSNQGKVLKLASLSPASSHFVSNGLYTRFADWRFIHKARLNLVPLNGCMQWKSGADKLCRRCGNWAETLPHVVNHCAMHSHAWQLRHNAIVDRLVQAMQRKASILTINQAVCGTSLRPDITARVGNNIFIIDVTCPFEGSDSAFTAAFENKSAKYETLIPLYQAQGLRATIVPFIVGALGSWCPWNDKLLKNFCTNSYIAVFRKLCVSDTIKWSRDIYTEHITGHRQYLVEDTASPTGDLSEDVMPNTDHHLSQQTPSSSLV
ncbi:retrovirus-related Pol polyprotein from type-1 retrotransposable element R2 [Caerostris darwini]|uniref:Retrovirus-related Pol polyprotein from type-1 retrotransposable element R2 n=1 Tax=Caerostris darwini TaxID=1538125 RepID=A0AAV4PNM8_9ARAC|nr:retrovirus-related Pol polyprotein from type-1 retrotransposable element R2 [Caerostris darwini]